MSHNPSHIIIRNGSFVFNRRVPAAVVSAFGCESVRLVLGRDKEQAEALSLALSAKLDEVWTSPSVKPIEVSKLLELVKPQTLSFDDAINLYLQDRGYGRGQRFEETTRLACTVLLSVAGCREIESYTREDAKAIVRALRSTGVKTATIRRRLDTIKAIFEHAYFERDIEKRNPFARLQIAGEGLDATKRGTFTNDQLREAYRIALSSGSEIKRIVPMLGETGCRLAEIVGLRLCDVDIENELIRIVPHPARRLKTKGSERELPLVGAALDAMRQQIEVRGADKSDASGYLFPRYEKDGTIRATHASNAVNKWLKRDFEGLTCHCLRHTFRDRLRAVDAPMDMIDQIGGWSSAQSIGVGYGLGYTDGQIKKLLSQVAIVLCIVTKAMKRP